MNRQLAGCIVSWCSKLGFLRKTVEIGGWGDKPKVVKKSRNPLKASSGDYEVIDGTAVF